MDWRRGGSPIYNRQHSSGSSTGSSSPSMSPAHHRSSSGSTLGFSSIRRTQNLAAKAANARLAQVMASQSAGEEEEEEDDDGEVGRGGRNWYGMGLGSRGSGNGGAPATAGSLLGRATRSPSPASGRNVIEHTTAFRSTSTGRPSMSARQKPLLPPSRQSLRIPSPIPVIETPIRKEKRFLADIGHLNSRDSGNHQEASALRDELDMLQEENENILAKLRLAEDKREEVEARARELEKQVAALGEGVSLEARLLSRKEAALRQREAALKAATQTKDGRDEEVTALRQQVESAKEEVASAVDQLREAESEAKALRSMTQRMILMQEEMEEVVLKRCWLARYWDLAVHYGVYPDIAVSKYEHWSSLAPLPLELVISAGQKAKEESWNKDDADLEKRDNLVHDVSDITGEGNIESMLSVEKGLRELASLKVEDAVMLAMANQRRPNLLRQSISDNKSPGDPKFMEAFELNKEETEDVFFKQCSKRWYWCPPRWKRHRDQPAFQRAHRCRSPPLFLMPPHPRVREMGKELGNPSPFYLKQAWLTYFWRRAKNHGLEDDIAEERLQFWISHTGQSPTSHDAVDVERGLLELRKLGIEQQLWEASRREIELASPTNHE